MKGHILGFDGTTGAITGEDGQRYSFTLADWKGERPPQARDAVDFVGTAGVATDVYHVPSSLGAVFSAGGGGSANGGIAFVAGRPQVALEGLLIVASLLPFLSGGLVSTNLFGFPSAVNQLAQIASLARSFGAGGTSSIGILAPVAYLFWLIPLGAAFLLYREFTNSRMKQLELGVGGLGAFTLVYFVLLSGGLDGFGFGAVVIFLCGIGLILTGLGKFNRIPGM